METKNVTYENGIFESISEVFCPFPEVNDPVLAFCDPSGRVLLFGYNVYISNNGTLFGDVSNVYIYDSTCMEQDAENRNIFNLKVCHLRSVLYYFYYLPNGSRSLMF